MLEVGLCRTGDTFGRRDRNISVGMIGVLVAVAVDMRMYFFVWSNLMFDGLIGCGML